MTKSKRLARRVNQICMNAGARVCGIAAAESFGDAPEGFRPRDLYADCASVVVFALPVPRGTAAVDPRIVYGRYNYFSLELLDEIAFRAAAEIEQAIPGAVAVPLPSDSPYEYWVPERQEGRGILSLKHAAVKAGLGTLGRSTLLLNAEYGGMLNLGALLTNLSLEPDPPAEPVCLSNCRICIDGCPAGAISETGVDQSLCRAYTYAANERGFDVVNCNACRTRCPNAFGCGEKRG